MNFFKTLLCAVVLAVVAIPSASAQFSVGAGLAYGTDIEEIGIQARGQYQFSEQFRGSLDFLYYLIGDGLSAYEINPNVHYTFSDNGATALYGLAGLNIAVVSVDFGFGSANDSRTGFNIGAGITQNFGGITGQAEVKYEIGGFEQLVIGAGVLFPLGGN